MSKHRLMPDPRLSAAGTAAHRAAKPVQPRLLTALMRMSALAVVLACLAVVNEVHALCVDGNIGLCTSGGQVGTRECVEGHWGPCEIPDNPNSPPSPGRVTLTNRATDWITVTWIVPERATSYAVERSDGYGWVEIPSSGTSRVDTGLAPDTRYCYRLRASNSYGSSLSPSACAFTKDGRGLSVSRVVLQITTGDVADAGTNDSVAVSIGGAGAGSVGGTTWLDHSIDDFERNSTHEYDLVRLDGIAELGDIHSLVFFTDGDDDWCLKGVTLLVDNVEVFSTTFGASCEWIGTYNSGGFVSHATLRADPRWTAFTMPLPAVTPNPDGTITAVFTIPRSELEARIEAMVGHSIHGTNAYWGELYGRAVEATTFNGYVANVDLDLATDVLSISHEVDIDFDLDARTHQSADGNWHLDLATTNVNAQVDLAWWEDLLDYFLVSPVCTPVWGPIEGEAIPFCLGHLAELAADRIEASFPRLKQSFGVGSRPLSLTAFFDSETNLVVTAILPPFTSPNPGPGPGDPGPDPEPDPGPDPCGLSATPTDATPSLQRRPNCDG